MAGISAHPDSPAGGGGPGVSRPPAPVGQSVCEVGGVHPDAPASRYFSLPMEQNRRQIEITREFRIWVAEGDLRQISQPISEWESAGIGAQNESGLYQGPQKLARGNFGERAATEALAADGHTILSYKPAIAGTNQGGIDMVTLLNGVVHFIDNKALTRSGNVSSVSALTTNFAKNRAAVVQEFTQYLNDLARPAAERAMFQRAVDNINNGKFVRAVTNANLAPDTAILSDISDKLKKLGLVFMDVMHSRQV